MILEVPGGSRLDLVEAKERAWAEEQPAYGQVMRLLSESPKRVFGAERLRQAFKTLPTAVVCIDEGVSLGDASATEVAIAGSGVFLPEAEITQFASTIRGRGLAITTVTYHDVCGAAGLYAAERGMNTFDAARQAAQRLMKALGLRGEPTRVGYDGAAIPMKRDPHFHHNVAIVVDGTGRINLPALGMPASLQLSGRYYPTPDRLRREVALAETITFDPAGGLGERFTPDRPLLLVLVSDESSQDWNLSSLEEMLGPVLTREDHRTVVVPMPIYGLAN